MTVSAPGKLMLMGEHAVLYGQPCIVTAIQKRLTVVVEETGQGVQIDAPHAKDTTFVQAAISRATAQWNLTYAGVRVATSSDFSGAYGFGSSAAVTAGVITAMAGEFGKTPTHEEIFNMGLEVVKEVQGAGSGFDIASAVWGGTLVFAKEGAIVEDLPDFRDCVLVVGYTGTKADTKKLIEEVAKKHQTDAKKVDRIFSAIGELVMQGKEAFVRGDWKRLGVYMNFNQEYLRDLGVSTQKLEDLISAAKKSGAWGAKLSGAGGGDCMIAIASQEKKDAVRQALQQAGAEVVDVAPHDEGIRVEESA